MSRRHLTIIDRSQRPRPKPTHVVEPDKGQTGRIYGDLPPIEDVKKRMLKLGMKGEPIASVLLKISKTGLRGYWIRVYVGVIEANAIRIFSKRGRGVYSPPSYVTTSFKYAAHV